MSGTGRGESESSPGSVSHALVKRVILITQESKPLPFDIKTSRQVPQDTTDSAGLDTLEAELVKAFESLPQRYQFDPRRMWKSRR